MEFLCKLMEIEATWLPFSSLRLAIRFLKACHKEVSSDPWLEVAAVQPLVQGSPAAGRAAGRAPPLPRGGTLGDTATCALPGNDAYPRWMVLSVQTVYHLSVSQKPPPFLHRVSLPHRCQIRRLHRCHYPDPVHLDSYRDGCCTPEL